MKKAILMLAVVFMMSVPMVYADDSSMTGDAILSVKSLGITANAAGVASADAHTGSVVIKDDSYVNGTVSSTVYGSAVVANAALGIGAYANLASVEVTDGSSLDGDVTTEVKGFAVVNMALGVGSNAHMGSVVIK